MLEKCKGTPIEVVELETRYPQGAEKMMIKVLNRKRSPIRQTPHGCGMRCSERGIT